MLRRALSIIGYGGVFLAATAVGAVVHLDRRGPRRAIAHIVNGVLADSFTGCVEVAEMGSINVLRGSVSNVRAAVYDAHGAAVASVEGVYAEIDLPALVRSVIAKKPMRVAVKRLSIPRVDGVLIDDGTGTPTLASAFNPKTPTPPDPTSKGVDLSLDDVTLGELWAHGALASTPIDAEIADLGASVALRDGTTSARVTHLAWTARSLPGVAISEADGTIEGSLVLPANADDLVARGAVTATAGDVHVSASGTFDHQKLDARVDVPAASAAALRRIVPESPLNAPVSVSVHAFGTFPDISVTGQGAVGTGTIAIGGSAKIGDTIDARANVSVERVTLRDLAAAAPTGSASLNLSAHAAIHGASIKGDYSLATQATTIAEQPIPAVETRGNFTEASVEGEADVHEPGAKVHVTYGAAPTPADRTIYGAHGGVTVDVDALSQVSRLGKSGAIFGSLHGHAEGTAVLAKTPQFTASATFRGEGVGTGGVRAKSIVIDGEVRGPASDPQIATEVTVNGLAVGGQDLKRVRVRASGAALHPYVHVRAVPADGGEIEIDAPVDLRDGVHVRGLDARASRNGEAIDLKVASVDVRGASVRVNDVHLTGTAGDLTASVSRENGSMHVVAKSDSIDLDHLAKLAGASEGDVRGTVAFDADVTMRGDDAKGVANVLVSGVAVGDVHDAHASIHAEVGDHAVSIVADAGVGVAAKVTIAAKKIALAGAALKAASWKDATGSVDVTGDVDLAALKDELPQEDFPVTQASGTASLRLNVARTSGKALPIVDATIATRKVRILDAGVDDDGDVAISAPTFADPNERAVRYGGADLDAHVVVDGEAETVALDATVTGKHGVLATTKVSAKPALHAYLADPTPAKATALVNDTKLDAVVNVARVAIADLPNFGRPAGVTGDVEASVSLSGTARDPSLKVDAKAYKLAVQDSRVDAPVDVETTLAFAKDKATVTVSVTRDGAEIVSGHADVAAVLADFASGVDKPRWSADADLDVKGFPLPLLNALGTEPLAGCAFASVKLRGLHQDAKVDASFWATDLQVGAVSFSEARVDGTADGTGVHGEAHLVEADGSLFAKGKAVGTWGEALLPAIDLRTPAEVNLTAKAFRLRPLAPFATSVLASLDGRLDADVHASVGAGGVASGKVEGKVVLSDGVVDVRALGQELRAVRATVVLTPDGTLTLSDASANGITGVANVDAVAHLEGLALKDAAGHLRIQKGKPFLVTLQGVELGSAWGSVDFSAQSTKDKTTVAVDVPDFDFQLPDTAQRAVQDLDAEPTIRIGSIDEANVFHPAAPREQDGTTTTAAPDVAEAPKEMTAEEEAAARAKAAKTTGANDLPPAPLVITVKVGSNVRVHQVGLLEAWPTGNVAIAVAPAKVSVAGKINVNRGSVEVQGRRFDIERTIASFDPAAKPSNPTITAEAVYVAADDTRVMADFVGTVERGHLQLRSDPPLSQNEILSLVAFGSTDGLSQKSNTQNDESGVAKAAGIGGGYVTQGLNKALTHITPVEITTRVDTSDSQDPRPEIGVQVSRRVTATVSYALGIPTPGQAPDRSMLKLDYRFHPRWILETTLGDHGTSIVDLLWKYRY